MFVLLDWAINEAEASLLDQLPLVAHVTQVEFVAHEALVYPLEMAAQALLMD